jgi:putative transposase
MGLAVMARQPRIEYPGAIYHVMAKGNRQEAIVHDEADRYRFIETLAEACGKTGWLVHAWVVMDTHYHAIIETPQGNLVAGMRWFQNTYTRRFNIRHRQGGHLFAGRYKAVLVEGVESGHGDYLGNLIDYVHLNPVRAGLIDLSGKQSLSDYRWSSLVSGYLAAPRKRVKWMKTEAGYGIVGIKDTLRGRQEYLGRIEAKGREAKGAPKQPEKKSLPSTLVRGWYWGTEQFKELLLSRANHEAIKRNRNYQTSQMGRDHTEEEAEKLVRTGLNKYKLSEEALERMPGSDRRKVAIAQSIHNNTTVSQKWIAERLRMKSAANVSQQLGRERKTKRIK